MSEKVFMRVVCAIVLIGMIITGVLIKFTIDNYKNLSITSFISTEEVLHE